MLANIEVDTGARKRPLDRENIDALKRSIQAQGLLQPIGVKRGTPGEKMRLVWGFHRFAAMCELTSEAEARGEQSPGSVASIIFPADAPDWQIRAAEIVENLVRKELTPDERAAHTMLLAAELKASGMCATLQEVGAGAGRKGGRGNKRVGASRPNPLQEKPTATQAVAQRLGVDRKTVERRANAAAKAAGVDAVSIERDTPETLREVGNRALEMAPQGKRASARHHAPEPAPSDPPPPEQPGDDAAPRNVREEEKAAMIAAMDAVFTRAGAEGVKAVERAFWKPRGIDPRFLKVKG